MATTESTANTKPLHGLWLGGTFHEVRPATYVNPETKEERQYQVATFHVTGVNADYERVSLDQSTRLDLPKDTPILLNVRAYVSKNELRYQLAKDYPSGFWMPSLETTSTNGEVTPMVGLFAVGAYDSQPTRQWRDRTTGKINNLRFLKLHMPRPTAPDYLMLDIEDGVTLPEFRKGQEMTVPVTVGPSAKGVRYRLSREFEITDALRPEQTAAA
ncbi:MAG: hypothetical protein ABL901_05360 [Hyphomicrobiaceae bacterium]